MSTAKTIDQFVRITSSKGKLYLALKDGKKHTITELKRITGYTGFRGFWGPVYGLNRLLKSEFGKQITIVDRFEKTGTLQMVPFAQKRTSKPVAKKVTKKATKPVAKETVAA